MTRVTTEQAAKMAVQGIFAKADRDAADRLRREVKPEAMKKATDRASERLRSFKGRLG